MTTIYITDNTGAAFDTQVDISGSYTSYVPPGATGTWGWVGEKYGSLRLSGTFTPSTGGTIPVRLAFANDLAIFQSTRATVEAYTVIATLDQLYDYAAYYRTQFPQYYFGNSIAGTIYFNCNLVLDSTAPSVFSYNAGTNTLTVKTAATLSQGSNNTVLNTTESITTSGTSITCLYQTSSGLSSRLLFSNLFTTSIYIKDSSGAEYEFTTGLTGTHKAFVSPSSSTGTWKWVAERYGYRRNEGTLLLDGGGDFNLAPSWVVDSTITEASPSVVATYTVLNTSYTVNDYEAYWRTTHDGIVYSDTLARNGDTIDWTPYNVNIDAAAAVPYSLNAITNTIVVKATNLVANTVTTSGVVSLVNGAIVTGVITDLSGVTTQVKITGLTGCSVAVRDGSNVIYDFQSNVTGTYTLSIPSSYSGTWNYIITKFGKKSQSGAITLGVSTPTTISYAGITDDRVVASSVAVVTGYTALDTTQKMYDYWSYWVTLEEGVPWFETVTWNGTILDLDGADVDIDPSAPVLAFLDPSTHKVTIKTTTISGDITTSGTIVRLGGSKTTGLVTDATGTTTIITFSGFAGADNKLFLQDAAAVTKRYTGVSAYSYVVYLLPSEATAGTWVWASKRPGYQHASGDLVVSGGGRLSVAVGMSRILQPDGTPMYQAGAPSTGISVDWTTNPGGDPRIKLGNFSYLTQDVYNACDLAMATEDGLHWIAAGNSDVRIAILPAGNFIFLSTGWRFMESAPGNDNAGVNGFGISTDGQTVDNTNGPVSLLSTSSAISDADLTKIRETWDRVVNRIDPHVDDILVDLEDIKGTGFVKDIDSLVDQTALTKTAIGSIGALY